MGVKVISTCAFFHIQIFVLVLTLLTFMINPPEVTLGVTTPYNSVYTLSLSLKRKMDFFEVAAFYL